MLTNAKLAQMVEIYGEDLVTAQLENETSYKKLAEEILATALERSKEEGGASELSIGLRLIDKEFNNVLHNVQTFIEYTIKPRKGVKPSYHGLVQQMASIFQGREKDLYSLLTFATFSVMLNCAFRREYRLSNLSQIVGREIYNEIRMEAYIKQFPEVETSVMNGISERVGKHFKTYYALRRQEYSGFNWQEWDGQEAMHLGCKLVELVMAGCGYFEEYHEVTEKGDGVTEIRPTQWLLETWAKNEERLIEKAYRLCPTVIPPQDWENFEEGGYWGALASSSTLLRLHDTKMSANHMNTFTREYMAKLNQLELAEVRGAVNAIQKTPWKINTKVLEVIKAVIARGGNVGNIPSIEPEPMLPRLEGEYTEEEMKAHKQACVDRIRREGRRMSKAIRTVGHVKLAEQFAQYDHIYFPHNMDFRGRVYPIPSFSPQGDDINKSLLLFADVPACNNDEDIYWMAVHGANLAGVDKVSYDERVAWVKANEEYILATAKDPLAHMDFWKDLDCPFQFVGFCFEWANWKAYQAQHGTAKGFITYLAVAWDGSCSGCQHYSAILRDEVGGKAVNLMPADKPQDIYRAVSDKVTEQLKLDAMNGTPDEEVEGEKGTYIKYGTKSLAQMWLNYGVDRKVTKRAVMTLPYGSKEYGFRDQLMEDIIVPAKINGKGDCFLNDWQCAGYMAKQIWNAVGLVVVKAVEGMKWLQDMARLVTKEGRTVIWTSPLGLPIQQSYMQCETEVLRLRFGGEFKRLYNYKVTGDVDKRSQASGIAPNFIHSMDASHLQLTVLMANEAGIKHFAMIHDSYGAPVAQAGLMHKMVREAFIKMYTEHDVLEDFREDMLIYIADETKVPEIPPKGNLKLETIRDSKYTFC